MFTHWAMIRQICNVKQQDTANVRSTELLARLGIEDLDLILKERRLRWYGMWNAPTVQSIQPLTYRLLESVGLGGPRWLGSNWQRETAESGNSQLSTLMIETPGHLVWVLHAASQLPGRGSTVVTCTCTLIKIRWWWWWWLCYGFYSLNCLFVHCVIVFIHHVCGVYLLSCYVHLLCYGVYALSCYIHSYYSVPSLRYFIHSICYGVYSFSRYVLHYVILFTR